MLYTGGPCNIVVIDSTRKRTLPRKKQDKLGSSEILNFLRGMTPRTRIVVLWSSLTFDVRCFKMDPHFYASRVPLHFA